MGTLRGDRLLSIMLFLQSHGQASAKELARKLEVSKRTIYRDIEALSSIGVPVYAERGRNGGLSLIEGYETKLTGLDEFEIRALFVSPAEQILEDLGLNRNSERARNKLIASLPPIYREIAKRVWGRIHVDISSWRAQQEKMNSFEVIKDAIWKENKLKIVYQHLDGKINEVITCPLGLVSKGNHWYYIASKENGDIRNYRISRICEAIILDEAFSRPLNFDLAQYWKSSTEAFIENLPSFDVSVEVKASLLPRLKFTGRFARIKEVGPQHKNGWVSVELSFDTEDEAKGYILGFADDIKIIKPIDLRDKILKMAESVVALYRHEDRTT